MSTTIDQLENRIINLEKKVQGIILNLERIVNELVSKVNSNDLSRTDALLRELILANSKMIDSLSSKLSKIILPEETRYYLDGGEVQSFQSNFNKLKGMMTQMDKLYKNLIAYEVQKNK